MSLQGNQQLKSKKTIQMIPTYFVSAVYFPVPVPSALASIRLRLSCFGCICARFRLAGSVWPVSAPSALGFVRSRLFCFGSVCAGFPPVPSVVVRLRLRWFPFRCVRPVLAPFVLISVRMRLSCPGSVCVDFCPDASVLSRLCLR